MLVLSRKVGERIHIGQDIILEVMEIEGGRIRLGVIAPKNIPVYREELLKQIKEQKDSQP